MKTRLLRKAKKRFKIESYKSCFHVFESGFWVLRSAVFNEKAEAEKFRDERVLDYARKFWKRKNKLENAIIAAIYMVVPIVVFIILLKIYLKQI